VVGTVGASSGAEASQELNEARISQTGFVDSIQPFLAAADFALNPVFEGSGANVKNSEYISSRLPILTQEFGTRGFKIENKTSCFVFDFDNFVDCLGSAVEMSKDERQAMADLAFSENEADISMRAAVEKYLVESS